MLKKGALAEPWDLVTRDAIQIFQLVQYNKSCSAQLNEKPKFH